MIFIAVVLHCRKKNMHVGFKQDAAEKRQFRATRFYCEQISVAMGRLNMLKWDFSMLSY